MKNTDSGNPYADIIHLSRPDSGKYPHMPMEKRAAQFSPFAALTGHRAAIWESARLTEEKHELHEEAKTAIGQKLHLLHRQQREQPEITVMHFVPDMKKQGGQYVKVTGHVKKVDVHDGRLVLADGNEIYFDDIMELEGELFEGLFETD